MLSKNNGSINLLAGSYYVEQQQNKTKQKNNIYVYIYILYNPLPRKKNHGHVSLSSNQTGNKHSVCSLSGSQFMWQIYLYWPGPTGKIQYQNPVPKF